MQNICLQMCLWRYYIASGIFVMSCKWLVKAHAVLSENARNRGAWQHFMVLVIVCINCIWKYRTIYTKPYPKPNWLWYKKLFAEAIMPFKFPCTSFWALLVLYITSAGLYRGCTMMVDEQIQSYRICFELTKPNHSNLALLVPWSWSSTFYINSGLILS